MSDKKTFDKICPFNDKTLCSSKCGLFSEETSMCSITDIAISLDAIMSIIRDKR